MSSPDSIGDSGIGEWVSRTLEITERSSQDYLDTYIESHVPDSYVDIIIIYSLVFMYFQFLEKYKEQDKFIQLL